MSNCVRREVRRGLAIVAALAGSALLAGTAGAVTISVDALTSGFMKESGNGAHIVGATIENYQAGYNKTTDETAKNWFVFDLPTLAPGEFIADASLELYLPSFPPDAGFGYGSADPFEIFSLMTLDAAQLGIIDAPTIVADLATGADFDAWYPLLGGPGSDVAADGFVVKADEGSTVSFPFTGDGIGYLEGSLGDAILFGGLVSSIDNPPAADIAEGLFHHTHPNGIAGPETPVATLVLEVEVVPEPGTGVLVFSGLALMLAGRRR